MINAIIVDDEYSAIESLKWELDNFCSEVKIADTFTNPIEAISAINYLKPDVVFLDIEMPELDGFQMLKKLSYKSFDLIITTAYNQYAIQAFKENAIDYLLKPVDPDELTKAMAKIKKNHMNNTLGGNIERVFERMFTQDQEQKSNRIPIPLSDRILMVEDKDIVYCKGDGNYTQIILKDGIVHLTSKTMKNIEELLPRKSFLRVHKTFIVNINYISEYIRGDGGEVIMKNEENIPVSRSHKEALLKVLQIN